MDIKKYSKAIAALPGGLLGLAIGEAIGNTLTNFGYAGFNDLVMVVSVIITSATVVYAAPKNKE